ncbi:MAG: TolC family protein, partial [Neisseriaceae bacterium]|nr:TolC family protein [Neisseriaceae bacterium]
ISYPIIMTMTSAFNAPFRLCSPLVMLLTGLITLPQAYAAPPTASASAYAPGPSRALAFAEAQAMLIQYSPKLAAASAGVQSKSEQQKSLALLGGPAVLLTADSINYKLDADINLNRLGANIGSGNLPLPPVIDLPDVNVKRKGNVHTANALVVWPVYTGGKITGAKSFSAAQTDEAVADARGADAEVYTQLVTRYFGSQLAQMAADLRQDAVRAISVHDQTAQRMWEEGLIAKVERLQTKVALEDAKRQAEHADHDAKFAAMALQRLLQSDDPIRPSTPLFISQKPLPPLDEFIEAALNNHPGLAKVAAKKEQAEALHKIDEARWKPSVSVFAQQQLKSNDANRIIGVNVHWALWSGIDRPSSGRSGQARIRQAEYTDLQVREDISLLVEKNWRDVNNARQAYFALNSNIELATEFLRLRQAGLREGVSTMSDLIDAQVNLTKSKTERAQAANDYVQALIQLLSSAGMPEQFQQYLNLADARVKP